MTTDPGQAVPARPLHEMTPEDLSRTRYQLERTLKRMTAEDPGRGPLQQRLTAVYAILQARAQDVPAPAARPLPPGTYHLTVRIFADLFTDYDLHDTGHGYIALPKGTPIFTGACVGEVARQISTASSYEQPRRPVNRSAPNARRSPAPLCPAPAGPPPAPPLTPSPRS